MGTEIKRCAWCHNSIGIVDPDYVYCLHFQHCVSRDGGRNCHEYMRATGADDDIDND